jgi:hypothetical protein
MHVKFNTVGLSVKHFCRGKEISNKYYECLHILAPFQRHIILSSMVCLAVPHVSTLSHKGHYFREKVNKNKNVYLSTSFV